jgi:hypothetical protein
VWEWRFQFWNHWGEHLVGAQRAIYLYLRARGEDLALTGEGAG